MCSPLPFNSSGTSYDGTPAHYQIIVPADAATRNTSTTYYFYSELK